MLTAYSRVTVVTAERTIDLALPSALPLADVLPQVMRYASPDHVDGSPITWTLARLGGSSLVLSQTLADAGVLDGDVLELRGQQDDVRPALVEDVRDVVEDSVDAAGGVWSTRTTGSYVVMAGAVALALLGIASGMADWFGLDHRLVDLATPGAAVCAAAVLLFATWWADRFAREGDAQVAAAAAMIWAALLGTAIGDAGDLDGSATLAVAVASVAVTAGIARLLTPAATAHAAFAAVVLVAGLAHAVVGLLDLPTDQSRRILPVLGLLSVGVIPRVSLSVGGLASADYRVRHVGQLDLEALRARYRASNAILVGSVVGIATLIVWGGVGLDLIGEPWDRTLALSLAVAAILRSRLFSRTQHMLALRTSGLVVVAFALVRLAFDETSVLPWLVVAGSVALLAAVGLASLPMSEITRARVKRTLNIVEFVVIVDLLVVLCGAAGVYQKLGGII